jgi:hypothetical protein
MEAAGECHDPWPSDPACRMAKGSRRAPDRAHSPDLNHFAGRGPWLECGLVEAVVRVTKTNEFLLPK